MQERDTEKEIAQAARQAELENLAPIELAELERVVTKWMLLPDTAVIKFLCALYIANTLPRKAVWTIIIGPSGGGKTAILEGLLSLSDIFEISTLTPNTFLSGMPGTSDASLLPKIGGKIMLFKDWTSILSMNKDAKSEIMGQLREIWDGHATKIFGNGKIRHWVGKVSLIAASTQAVDISQQQMTSLGERFINYRLPMADPKETARRSLENDDQQEQMTREMQNAFYAYLKGVDLTKISAKIPPEETEELISVACFCVKARSGVFRDFNGEVTFVPATEMPGRMIKQLNSIATGFAILNGGEFMPSDMKTIYKCALDSIPSMNTMVIAQMAAGKERTTAEIAVSLGYPTTPIRKYLENLALLGICTRVKGTDSEEGGNADKWTMKDEYTEIMLKYQEITAEIDKATEEQVSEAQKELDEQFG